MSLGPRGGKHPSRWGKSHQGGRPIKSRWIRGKEVSAGAEAGAQGRAGSDPLNQGCQVTADSKCGKYSGHLEAGRGDGPADTIKGSYVAGVQGSCLDMDMGREGHFVLTERPLGERSSWGHLPSGVGMAGAFPASQGRWQLRGGPHSRPALSPQWNKHRLWCRMELGQNVAFAVYMPCDPGDVT